MIGRTVVNGAKKEKYNVTLNYANTSLMGLFQSSGYGRFNDDYFLDIILSGYIEDISYMFVDQNYMWGTILFDCNPTEYSRCFHNGSSSSYSSKGITCNYTAICTNIDSIINTAYKMTVKKGSLVVV